MCVCCVLDVLCVCCVLDVLGVCCVLDVLRVCRVLDVLCSRYVVLCCFLDVVCCGCVVLCVRYLGGRQHGVLVQAEYGVRHDGVVGQEPAAHHLQGATESRGTRQLH